MRKNEMDDVMKNFFTNTDQKEPEEPERTEPENATPGEQVPKKRKESKKNAPGSKAPKKAPESKATTKEAPREEASKMGIKKAAPKSERIQALVRPNTKERLWEIAKTEETSFNELMNYILESFIEKYDERS